MALVPSQCFVRGRVIVTRSSIPSNIDPRFQNLGAGTTLLHALIARADALGMHVMIAAIEASNAVSIDLHHKAGLEQSGYLSQVGFKFDIMAGSRADAKVIETTEFGIRFMMSWAVAAGRAPPSNQHREQIPLLPLQWLNCEAALFEKSRWRTAYELLHTLGGPSYVQSYLRGYLRRGKTCG